MEASKVSHNGMGVQAVILIQLALPGPVDLVCSKCTSKIFQFGLSGTDCLALLGTQSLVKLPPNPHAMQPSREKKKQAAGLLCMAQQTCLESRV